MRQISGISPLDEQTEQLAPWAIRYPLPRDGNLP